MDNLGRIGETLSLSSSSSAFSLSISAAVGASVIVSVLALQLLLSRPSSFLSRYSHRLHLQRRLQHVVTCLLLTFLSTSVFPLPTAVLLLSSSCLLVLSLHIARLHWPQLNALFLHHCASLLRPHEHRELPAGFFLLLGFTCALTLSLLLPSVFTLPVATLSLLIESLADPVAAVTGQLLSSSPSGCKTIAGSAGMAATSAALLLLYAGFRQTGWRWLLTAPVLAALVERCCGRGQDGQWWAGIMDDNFMVPVLCTALLSLLQLIAVLPPLLPAAAAAVV
jgi:dolichol kinase